ncbi:MAG: NAD-dependent protein deacetylase [Mycobacteriales bacterium]|nr:NAD-dependent protein deacetylase [Mycobacteriales bacterium]
MSELREVVAGGDVLVLTGAGLSTASGIPDYRGPQGSLRRHTPMTHQAFTGSPEARQRYWARSHLGWSRFGTASPNPGHLAVTALQDLGLLIGVVTQNVDGLHTAAGTRDVVDLHGRLDRVVCLDCGDVTARDLLAARLADTNTGWTARAGHLNPDGDVELDDESGFTVVDCLRCGSVLKPDVVFFGGSVPRDLVEQTYALADRARALLVLGSSLQVMSGYRFALHAAKRGVPVVLVNQGETRADHLAALKVEAPLQDVLPALAKALAPAAIA